MAEQYVVPSIYEDMSNQSQGYFAFRFTCQECRWSVESPTYRSSVSTATNVMDIGVGLLGGFWGRAAQAGEQMYGSKWHAEQAGALQNPGVQSSMNFTSAPLPSHCLYALLQYQIEPLHRPRLRSRYESRRCPIPTSK